MEKSELRLSWLDLNRAPGGGNSKILPGEDKDMVQMPKDDMRFCRFLCVSLIFHLLCALSAFY